MGYDPSATRLGSAALEVSQLGLGCGPLGGFRRALPEDEAEAIVRAACEAGLRLFDTAPLYGYGRSELRVGHVLRQVPRDSFVLSTKVGAGCRRAAPVSPTRGCARAASTSCRPTTSATTASCARSSSRTAGSASPRSTSC